MVLPAGAATHEVDERQHFLMAASIRSPMPQFPDRVRVPDGVYEVCVRFVVTEMGEVEQVEFPDDAPECAVSHVDPAPFQHAVADALSRWSFTGAAICTFPEGVEVDERCEAEGVDVRAVPIRLMYVFSFSQADGRKSVTAE